MKLSIVIPTYNEEREIGGALDSLARLSLPHEVIVTDDVSADSTVDAAKRSGANLVLSPHKKHATIGANRNDGAHRASGDYLVFMDADSRIADPDAFFARALAWFDHDLKLLALTGALRVRAGSETRADYLVYTVFNWVHRIKNNLLHRGEASTKFQMMRRSAFEAVHGFDPRLVTREDGDLFLRLSKIGKTFCDPRLVVFHSGRRAHKLGWPRLLWIWFINWLTVSVFHRSLSKDWKAVR